MAELSYSQKISTFLSNFNKIASSIRSISGDSNQETEQILKNAITFFEKIDVLFQKLEKAGYMKDFWLLSTYLRVSKNSSKKVADKLYGKFQPVTPIRVINIAPVLSTNSITRLLFQLKTLLKPMKIVKKYEEQKNLEFQNALEIEICKIPKDTTPDQIRAFRNYFTNIQGTWEDYLLFLHNKQISDEKQRILEIQTAKLKEEKLKKQFKEQEQLFEERGGYDSLQAEQIQSARKKALVPKKKSKKPALSSEIEEKIEQKKLLESKKTLSEDRAQKFFEEKQKKQQDYLEKLRKLQKKGKD